MPLDSTNWSRTQTETKPDVFSLEGLIAWLEMQPPEKTYNWHDCEGLCLVGQYYVANGVHRKGHFYDDLFYPHFSDGSYGEVALTRPPGQGPCLSTWVLQETPNPDIATA